FRPGQIAVPYNAFAYPPRSPRRFVCWFDRRSFLNYRTFVFLMEQAMARTVGSSGVKTLQAIHGAGLELIYRHGYEAMSLRDLAAAVGIQQGSLYNHIANKQGLLFDLVRNHLEQLIEALDHALNGVEGSEARLRAFVHFHVHYHMVRRAEVFVVNNELRSLEPDNYKQIVAMRRTYEVRLTA